MQPNDPPDEEVTAHMTEPESNPPELSPAEEDAVRRHLAAARHTEPMPDAVAERLDRVLVGLADERGLPGQPSRRSGPSPTWRPAAGGGAAYNCSSRPLPWSSPGSASASCRARAPTTTPAVAPPAAADQGNGAMEGGPDSGSDDKPGAAPSSEPDVPALVAADDLRGRLTGCP